MSRQGHAYRGKRALELIEEAMHALRVCPLPVLSIYYIGALPFVLGFLFFWSDMSRSGLALEHSVGASLGMAALYFWMKCWQAVFCRKLMAQWTPDPELLKLTKREWVRCIAAQCFVQSLAIPLHILAANLLLPFAWVFAFFQNVTVCGFTQAAGGRPTRAVLSVAARQSVYLPRQNHVLILVGGLFALFVWLNVFSVLAVAPILMKRLLGIESVFTTNPAEAFLNTTFFAVSIAVAFLCVSPIVKIVYTLRCFYGISATTGTDLSRRLDFLRARRELGRRTAAVAGVIVLLGLAFAGKAGAQTAPRDDGGAKAQANVEANVEAEAAAEGEEGGEISPETMESAIESVIARGEYAWRLPRMRPGDVEGGPVASFFRRMADGVRHFFGMIADAIEKGFTWVLRWLLGRDFEMEKPKESEPKDWGKAMLGLVYLLSALLIAVLAVLAVRAIRRRVMAAAPADEGVGTMARVDLESEEIVASQLPEDEWMKLAREQIERGDYRLAVRALFLASLASLGEKQLLLIEKSKSNRDYERELRLRSRADAALTGAFADNVGIFERAWYGLHDVSREAVDLFTSNCRRITTHGTRATEA